MIRDIQIRRFRGIETLELEGLGRMNVIVGPNGSSKTALLQALFTFALDGNPDGLLPLARPETDEPDLSGIRRALDWIPHRAKHSVPPTETIELDGHWKELARRVRVTFRGPTTGTIHIPANGAHSQGSSGVSAVSVARVDDDFGEIVRRAERLVTLHTQHGTETFEGSLALVPNRGLVGRRPSVERRVRVVLRPVYTATGVAAQLSPPITRAEEAGRLESIVEFLRRFDEDVLALRVGALENGTSVARVVHKHLGMVPITSLGDGFVAATSTLLTLLEEDYDLALMDEFDSSLHAGIVRDLFARLLEIARDRNMQMFVTTHRADTLEGLTLLEPELLDGVRILQLSRSGGSLRAKVIAAKDAVELIESVGLDLREPA